MKTIGISVLALALVSATNTDPFEEHNGIGILLIHESADHNTYTVALFDSIGEGQPHAKWIERRWGESDFWTQWNEFLPFSIDSPSNEPFLVCMEERGEWFRVRLKGDRDYWVRQEDHWAYRKFELQTWESVMGNRGWVNRLDRNSNPIRTKPSERSKVIPFEGGDCLSPISARGWWIEVEPHNGEGCLSDTISENDDFFKKLYFNRGWVQWRNDSAFLLRTSHYD